MNELTEHAKRRQMETETELKKIFPYPRPIKLKCKKKDILTFKNNKCKHYLICMSYVAFNHEEWDNFSCKKCLWKENTEGKETIKKRNFHKLFNYIM